MGRRRSNAGGSGSSVTLADGPGVDSQLAGGILTLSLDPSEVDWDGWISSVAQWYYGDGTRFAIPGNLAAYYGTGTRLSWNDGSVKYGVSLGPTVLGAALSGVSGDPSTDTFTKTAHGLDTQVALFGATPITLTGGIANLTGLTVGQVYWVVPGSVTANTFQITDSIGGAAINMGGSTDAGVTFDVATRVTLITSTTTLANAALNSRRYSQGICPNGFPTWFAWTPTFTGYSVDPSGATYRWKCEGRSITINILQNTNGTSNNTAHTMTLPATSAGAGGTHWAMPCLSVDNGTKQNGLIRVPNASATCNLFGILATETNTNTGGSRIVGQVTYEI